MRNVAEDTAKQQIEQEIPFRSTRDAVLQEYLSRYTLKALELALLLHLTAVCMIEFGESHPLMICQNYRHSTNTTPTSQLQLMYGLI